MARVLQPPRLQSHNVRVYHNNGTLLASLPIGPRQRYLTWEMFYRYCSMIFILPHEERWALFPFSGPNEDIGDAIPEQSRNRVKTGNYLVLRHADKAETAVELTDEKAPRRVVTRDQTSRSRAQGQTERDKLQSRFRSRLIQRDDICAISNRRPGVLIEDEPHQGLVAAHIFPTSQVSQWNRYYRKYITDTSSATEVGRTRLYSSQNGLLLSLDMHYSFDHFMVGVDPDANYKIIPFGTDNIGVGGTRLGDSARYGTVPAGAPTNGVSPDLLRWHLSMCLYENMKANAEHREYWEEHLGEDDMGQILEQPDAAERMEVELFTRLGELIS